ncbi:hypothetical protein GOBAR_AA26597 [Gossypium barbadense]|uniref:Uncharacterized protein n=1 Tax=Gossypium barbadense TaxID=3634 RepID=A0A2P5WSL4_GOSBA|nr:hypothetical protein GOBAR_AA26597 [Gossypium barbadense]
MSLKEAHESFSSNSRGPVHEDRRLQIEELDEWQTHKPRTSDKSKLRQNKPDTSPNQLKVGDKVLLDVADPHIVTTTSNEETPLTFPRWPLEELFQILRARPLIAGRCIDWAAIEQVQLADSIRALLATDPWELFFGIIKPTYLELTMELCSTFHLQTAYIRRSSRRRMNYMLSVATYISLPRSAGTLWPLARPPTILAAPRHQFSHHPKGFQRFDNINATLQQICQHLHISSPVPLREPSSDEDV